MKQRTYDTAYIRRSAHVTNTHIYDTLGIYDTAYIQYAEYMIYEISCSHTACEAYIYIYIYGIGRRYIKQLKFDARI